MQGVGAVGTQSLHSEKVMSQPSFSQAPIQQSIQTREPGAEAVVKSMGLNAFSSL